MFLVFVGFLVGLSKVFYFFFLGGGLSLFFVPFSKGFSKVFRRFSVFFFFFSGDCRCSAFLFWTFWLFVGLWKATRSIS